MKEEDEQEILQEVIQQQKIRWDIWINIRKTDWTNDMTEKDDD